MDLYDVMRTTFAARDFVDEEVPDEVLAKILENARFAPSGGNRQGWKVIVVRKDETKTALKPLIMPTFQRYVAQVSNGEAPWNTINPTALSQEQIDAQPVAISHQRQPAAFGRLGRGVQDRRASGRAGLAPITDAGQRLDPLFQQV